MAIKVMAIKQDFVYIGNYEQNITLKKQNGEYKTKSKSKDDDDIINEVLVYLRKESSK